MPITKFSDEERAKTVIIKDTLTEAEADNIVSTHGVRPRTSKSGKSVYFVCSTSDNAKKLRDALKPTHPSAILSSELPDYTLVYPSKDINTLLDQASTIDCAATSKHIKDNKGYIFAKYESLAALINALNSPIPNVNLCAPYLSNETQLLIATNRVMVLHPVPSDDNEHNNFMEDLNTVIKANITGLFSCQKVEKRGCSFVITLEMVDTVKLLNLGEVFEKVPFKFTPPKIKNTLAGAPPQTINTPDITPIPNTQITTHTATTTQPSTITQSSITLPISYNSATGTSTLMLPQSSNTGSNQAITQFQLSMQSTLNKIEQAIQMRNAEATAIQNGITQATESIHSEGRLTREAIHTANQEQKLASENLGKHLREEQDALKEEVKSLRTALDTQMEGFNLLSASINKLIDAGIQTNANTNAGATNTTNSGRPKRGQP